MTRRNLKIALAAMRAACLNEVNRRSAALKGAVLVRLLPAGDVLEVVLS